MDDLERALSPRAVEASVRSGNELVFPFNEAKEAVHIASQNSIAILGVEACRILRDGLDVETYSGYEFESHQDSWAQFVRFNNDAALRFIVERALGHGYGYILTSTSQAEFKGLRDHFDRIP